MTKQNKTEALQAARSLEVDSIEELEAILRQEGEEEFDLNLYVAILKLYQFHPVKANYHNICLIAMKAALLGMQSNAFSACWYLIPEKLFDKKELREIMHLNELLEKMSLKEIWTNVYSYVSLASSLGWANAKVETVIRRNILDVVLFTYTRVPLSVFLEIMNFTSPDAMMCDPFMQTYMEHGTLFIDGNVLVVANNHAEHSKPDNDQKADLKGTLKKAISMISI